MQKHLLSAFVVLTPPLALFLSFIIRPGNIQPWPQILFIAYLVAALAAVIVIFRRGHLRTLGSWLGAALLVIGLLVLVFLADPNLRARDIPSILTVSGTLVGLGLLLGYFSFRFHRSSANRANETEAMRATGAAVSALRSGQHDAGEWVRIEDRGDEVIFTVRQKRAERMRRSLVLLGGLIAGALVSVASLIGLLLMVEASREESFWSFFGVFMLGLFALGFAIAAIAAIPSVFSGFRALAAPGNVTFTVNRQGLSANGGKTIVPFSALQGPYYRTSGPIPQELSVQQHGAPVAYVGYGVGGMAAVSAVAAAQGAQDLGRSMARSGREALHFVRRYSSGEVLIRNMARPVILARLLSDEEAEFLCEKTVIAVLRMAGQSPSAAAEALGAAQAVVAAAEKGNVTLNIDTETGTITRPIHRGP